MTEKDNFNLDNPIMYDKKNGRCRCIPIPHEKDRTEKRFEIMDGIDKGRYSGIWDNQKQHNQGIGDELWIGEVVDLLNEQDEKIIELEKENKKLKQLIQAIISKEFELSSEDNDYDPLTEFFNNEVNISQIEVEIDVEKED